MTEEDYRIAGERWLKGEKLKNIADEYGVGIDRLRSSLNYRGYFKRRQYKRCKRDCLYMYVTDDKYEFPIYIEESAELLAQKIGCTKNNVLSSLSHAKYRGSKSRFQRVILEDD